MQMYCKCIFSQVAAPHYALCEHDSVDDSWLMTCVLRVYKHFCQFMFDPRISQ